MAGHPSSIPHHLTFQQYLHLCRPMTQCCFHTHMYAWTSPTTACIMGVVSYGFNFQVPRPRLMGCSIAEALPIAICMMSTHQQLYMHLSRPRVLGWYLARHTASQLLPTGRARTGTGLLTGRTTTGAALHAFLHASSLAVPTFARHCARTVCRTSTCGPVYRAPALAGAYKEPESGCASASFMLALLTQSWISAL